MEGLVWIVGDLLMVAGKAALMVAAVLFALRRISPAPEQPDSGAPRLGNGPAHKLPGVAPGTGINAGRVGPLPRPGQPSFRAASKQAQRVHVRR